MKPNRLHIIENIEDVFYLEFEDGKFCFLNQKELLDVIIEGKLIVHKDYMKYSIMI